MENSEMTAQLKQLDKRSFVFEKKRFDVTDVNYYTGKFYVYTVQERTFIKDSSQFERFLQAIKMMPLDEPINAELVPQNEQKTMENNKPLPVAPSTTEVSTSSHNILAVNEALFRQFQKLSGEPERADYEQAEAMVKVANTIVSVSQVQINFLKLKQGV